MRKRFLLALGTALSLALVPSAAFAHHPDVVVTEDCSGKVEYTVTAWEGDGTVASRENPKIAVEVNGERAADGAFTEEGGFKFTASVTLDEPADVKVKVWADAPWGNGNTSTESREGSATAPTNCATTTTVAPTSSSVETTTTVAPTSSSVENSTTSTTVESTTTVAPTTSEVVIVPTTTIPETSTTEGGNLPFTGANSIPLALGALLLVAIGGGLVWFTKRRNARA